MVVKVENTFQQDDDYYVRFVNDYGEFEDDYDNMQVITLSKRQVQAIGKR